MLATIAIQAAVAAPPLACAARYIVQERHGTPYFAFKQAHPNTLGPSSIESPLRSIRCSPAGRVIVISEAENAAEAEVTQGSISITVIDPRSGRTLYDELAAKYDFSPDNRLIVIGPWGGSHGTGYELGQQTLDLLDVDASAVPTPVRLATIAIYPTDADAFHPRYEDTAQNAARNSADFDAWYSRFEDLPHPVTDIAWLGPRRFSFLVAKDADSSGQALGQGALQTVTVDVGLPDGKPPVINTTVVAGPACPGGLETDLTFAALLKHCAGAR